MNNSVRAEASGRAALQELSLYFAAPEPLASALRISTSDVAGLADSQDAELVERIVSLLRVCRFTERLFGSKAAVAQWAQTRTGALMDMSPCGIIYVWGDKGASCLVEFTAHHPPKKRFHRFQFTTTQDQRMQLIRLMGPDFKNYLEKTPLQDKKLEKELPSLAS